MELYEIKFLSTKIKFALNFSRGESKIYGKVEGGRRVTLAFFAFLFGISISVKKGELFP